ncbi:MAG: PST family polysaccharide transporter [Polaribacter sp.]|jgi:PST family polysaccharide transporter
MALNKFFLLLKSNNNIFKNFTYLTLVEIINIIVPFITLPYLIITLGKENYGLVIFAQSIISYFFILQNFGLETYAIKEVSIHAGNHYKLSKIVSNVITLKIILFLFILVALYVLSEIFPFIYEYRLLFFLSLWVCLFDVIFPKWYFQGIEKMKYITYIYFVSKISSLIFIFILIKSPQDYIKVPFIYGASSLIPGVISLIIVFKKDKLKFSYSFSKDLITTFKNSFTFFISDLSVSIFANSNKVIIGSVLGMTELAYYDLADKIISAFRNVPLNIVRNTIYPQVAKTKNLKLVKLTTKIMSCYAIVVIFILYLFGPYLIEFLGGEEMTDSINILRIFSITIFTTHILNYYLTVGLWSLGYEKTFRNLMIYSTFIFLVLVLILYIFDVFSIYTLTLLPILVDIYLIINTYYIYKKEKIF